MHDRVFADSGRCVALAVIAAIAFGCRDEAPRPSPPAQPTSTAATPRAAPPSAADAAPLRPPPAPQPNPSPGPKPAPLPAQAPPPAAEALAAMRAADDLCGDCHPDEADAWAASPMARTLRPYAAAPRAPFAAPAEVVDPRTGRTYRQRGGRFEVEAGPHRITRAPSHVLGSGRHTHTLLWAADDRLFQLPLSWYTARGGWALSPGYDTAAARLGFFREVGTGCLNCHADPVVSRPGSALRPQHPPGAMTCVRCHGDGRAHAAGRMKGEPTPIVNPDRLPPARAADVCAACHFGGAVRVLRPGRRWGDFLPGARLSDTVALFARSEMRDGFGSADQAGRLALSACAKQTPTMTCTTCHRPHDAQPAADRSKPCRDCHGGAGDAPRHACAAPEGAAAGADCADCHMDQGPTHNIPHTEGVDHFIRTRPAARPPANNDSPLRWIAHPEAEPVDPDHQILLGRAYVDAWRGDRQPRDAERAERWLTRGLARRPARADGWIALAALHRARGAVADARAAAERAFALEPDDRRHATLVGWARLQTGDAPGALAAIERARAVAESAELLVLRAVALRQLGRGGEALDAARAAAAREPSHVDAHLLLGEIAAGDGAWGPAAGHFEAAAAWSPGDVRGWIQLGRAEARRGRWAASRDAYARAERVAGPDRRAVEIARRGQAEAARMLNP